MGSNAQLGQPPQVAVVGGGASGALAAIALLRVPRRLDVTVFEPREAIGRGVAYSTGDPLHLMNVAGSQVSALGDDPDHFVRFGRSLDAGFGGFSFAPRRLYGDYLESTVWNSARAAHRSVEHVRACVRDLEPDGAGWQLASDRGSHRADAVVLATGDLAPAPHGPLEQLTGDPAYVHDPWLDGALDGLDRGTVLCVGSGLTMVDVALSLAAGEPGARIVAVSRRGLRPLAHRAEGAPVSPPPLLGLHPPTALGLLRALRREVRTAADQGRDWRDVINSLRPSTARIWQSLPPSEQRRAADRLARFWEVHRHRMAPQTAAALDRLEQQGRLQIRAGRIGEVRRTRGRLQVVLHRAEEPEPLTLTVDAVVNCTGRGGDPGQNELLGRLIERGACVPDHLSLGLVADAGGDLLDPLGLTSQLSVLGPLRRGQLWETTAVPEIRAQAERIALRLAASLEGERRREAG